MAGSWEPRRRSRERSGRTCLRRFREGTRTSRWRGYTAAWPIPPRYNHMDGRSLRPGYPSGWLGTDRSDVLRILVKTIRFLFSY